MMYDVWYKTHCPELVSPSYTPCAPTSQMTTIIVIFTSEINFEIMSTVCEVNIILFDIKNDTRNRMCLSAATFISAFVIVTKTICNSYKI